jgi:SNF2 family DNA or RNA helicase
MSTPNLPADFLDALNVGADLAEAPQPAAIGSTLFDFQRQALTFMLDCERAGALKGGILADEQGVGKTVMCAALVAANSWRPAECSLAPQGLVLPCGSTLIACTAAIEQQWARELRLHAPALRLVHFRGRPEGATHEAVMAEVARLAGADVVLASYDVLMRELRPLQQSFESVKEKRSSLNLRVRATDDDTRPSPLKYLHFWRVILDEVQKAPGSYAAGKTVRLVAATHRWTVSGTPMEHERLGDLFQQHACAHHDALTSPQARRWSTSGWATSSNFSTSSKEASAVASTTL